MPAKCNSVPSVVFFPMNKTLSNSGLHYYGNMICPYCQRAWFGLQQSGLSFTHHEVNFLSLPEALTAVTPFKKVPVLVDDGMVIYESTAILGYLTEKYSLAWHATSYAGRAKVRAWQAHAANLHDITRTLFATTDSNTFSRANEQLMQQLESVSTHLTLSDLVNARIGQLTLLGLIYAPWALLVSTLNEGASYQLIPEALPAHRWLEDVLNYLPVASHWREQYRRALLSFIESADSSYARRFLLTAAAH